MEKIYDFNNEENSLKWRGLLTTALKKVLETVHPSLGAKDDALEYVENLCFRLLAMLCAKPSPHTVQEVEYRVQSTFPTPIDKWALREAQEAIDRGKKKSALILPVDKIHNLLQKEILLYKIDLTVSLFLVGVLEYISADILKLAGNYVKHIKHVEITYQDVQISMNADKALMDMFYQDDANHENQMSFLLGGGTTSVSALAGGGVALVGGGGVVVTPTRSSLTYEEVVRELIASEKAYMRELHMLIKVFREELLKLSSDQREIDLIFSNIMDLYELTYTLSGSLEDVIEMAQDQMPYVGTCFEELAEAEEFQAYSRYARDVTSPICRQTLHNLFKRPDVDQSLQTAGQGMRLSLKYYLPALLMGPIRHCFTYIEYVRILKELSRQKEDKESLEQCEAMLKPLQLELARRVPATPTPNVVTSSWTSAAAPLTTPPPPPLFQSRARRYAALEKIQELERSVENWNEVVATPTSSSSSSASRRLDGQCCNEFVRDDALIKVDGGGRRLRERRAVLFDGVLLLLKPTPASKHHHHFHHHSYNFNYNFNYYFQQFSTPSVAVSSAGNNTGGGVSVLAGAQGQTNAVTPITSLSNEIVTSNQQPMAAPASTGNSALKLKERFFIRRVEIVDHADGDDLKNAFEICPRQQQSIVLCAKTPEDKMSWMADLVMLNNRSMLERILDSILSDIERKHPLKLPPPELYKFAEPDSKDNIVLEQRENGGVPLIKGATLYKLVERLTYHIYADPKFVRTFLTTFRSFCSPQELLDLLVERFRIPDPALVYGGGCESGGGDEKMQKCSLREDWKKYRKEYCQPVQFRVLNVLRHWVDHHFYDFERETELLRKLEQFLDSVNGKSMRKWVDSVLKIVQRKMENDTQRHIKFAFAENPPPIEWHIQNLNEEDYGILTLHPVEFARQLTILEFDLYRTIKPSELVGSVWTKKDKERTSPNLLRMIKHTTNFTLWLEKCIVEAANFEERVAIFNRIIEIMIVLQEMNNFNGVLAIVSATASASVHRLKLTYQALSQQKQRALDECRADDHFKKYQEKLRSINPPCVPFLGMYLTNILHIEEGNSDFLPSNEKLINFFKRRKVAEITGEIQQYQNQPYVYTVEPSIRHFLETLNPFGDMSENDVNNYLFNKSIEIEPRNCKQIPKFPRKWPQLNLKSPGIKASKITSSSSTSSSSVKQLIKGTTTLGVATAQQQQHTQPSTNLEESSKNNVPDNDFSVFAAVHLGGGTAQNSPTSPTPASPAASSWRHVRTPSTTSVGTPAGRRSEANVIPVAPRNVTAPLPSSPRTPTSPPHSSIITNSDVSLAPSSTNLQNQAPPIPPRKRRESTTDAGGGAATPTPSPQQLKQAPDAPLLPPREYSPPPLPPRANRNLAGAINDVSQLCSAHFLQQQQAPPIPPPSQFHAPPPLPPIGHHHFHQGHATLPRLHPTHASQLHKRRHSALQQQQNLTNGSTSVLTSQQAINTTPQQPPSLSPRTSSDHAPSPSPTTTTPKLPPKPMVAAIRSADFSASTTSKFQYPTT